MLRAMHNYGYGYAMVSKRRVRRGGRESVETIGRARLKDWLETGHSQQEMATALGVKQPAVAKWVAGVSRPEPHLRARMETITGIAADDWYTSVERAIAHARTA